MAHILAVDDDPDLCTLLKTALERDGHAVEIRTSGVTVTESLCRWADCILLDVMMPGEDGFAICRRIRAITQAPILFLTARTDEQSVLTGLGIGADDYLSKPFRVAELRARVAAHLRRQNRAPPAAWCAAESGSTWRPKPRWWGSNRCHSPGRNTQSASIWPCTRGRRSAKNRYMKLFLAMMAQRTIRQ